MSGSRSTHFEFDWSLLGDQLNPAVPDAFYQTREPPVNNFSLNSKVAVRGFKDSSSSCNLMTSLATVRQKWNIWVQLGLDGTKPEAKWWYTCNDPTFEHVDTVKEELVPPVTFHRKPGSFHTWLERQLAGAEKHPVLNKIPDSCLPEKNLFQVGEHLEAIDLENRGGQITLYPAVVSSVDGDFLWIRFIGCEIRRSGYPGLHVRFDSRNLFPVGYAAKAGMKLQIAEYDGYKLNWDVVEGARAIMTSLTSPTPEVRKKRKSSEPVQIEIDGQGRVMKKRRSSGSPGGESGSPEGGRAVGFLSRPLKEEEADRAGPVLDLDLQSHKAQAETSTSALTDGEDEINPVNSNCSSPTQDQSHSAESLMGACSRSPTGTPIGANKRNSSEAEGFAEKIRAFKQQAMEVSDSFLSSVEEEMSAARESEREAARRLEEVETQKRALEEKSQAQDATIAQKNKAEESFCEKIRMLEQDVATKAQQLAEEKLTAQTNEEKHASELAESLENLELLKSSVDKRDAEIQKLSQDLKGSGREVGFLKRKLESVERERDECIRITLENKEVEKEGETEVGIVESGKENLAQDHSGTEEPGHLVDTAKPEHQD